jgi:hypothetical protein
VTHHFSYCVSLILATAMGCLMPTKSQASDTFGEIQTACENMASNPHQCAKMVADAAAGAGSVDDLNRLSELWDSRYVAEIEKLRKSRLGLVKAKSDMELIRGILSDEIDGAIKGKIEDAILKKTVPENWKRMWEQFVSKYLKRLSTFLSNPLTQASIAALRASVPSEVASDFDELAQSNKQTTNKLWARWTTLSPPPSFLETVRNSAYKKTNDAVSPQLRPVPMARP